MYSQDSDDAGYMRGDEQFHNSINNALLDPIIADSLARHPPARPSYFNQTAASTAHEQQRSGGGASGLLIPSTLRCDLTDSYKKEIPDAGARRPVRQLRMVTILIQDLRSGETDHQLAEVKIPLKDADIKEDGFWADAKELVSFSPVSVA